MTLARSSSFLINIYCGLLQYEPINSFKSYRQICRFGIIRENHMMASFGSGEGKRLDGIAAKSKINNRKFPGLSFSHVTVA